MSFRPTHAAVAPGRVNLIGEHTDYNGLPVLPIAIQRSIRIELRARADRIVRFENADPRFETREFELARDIAPSVPGHWTNYPKAAAQALDRHVGLLHGVDGHVSGDIPAAAGLASSSALVVASALALLAANDLELDRLELMQLAALAERYVGTQSGGMDQAIALGGRAGHAVRVDFEPLRLEPIPVPPSWRFVVADSLVEARKAGEAQVSYNARVRECRAALLEVGRALGRPQTFARLVAELPEEQIEEIARALPFTLGRRFRHVVTEGLRVERAVAAMRSGDLATFGRLLDASHASLRDDYEASCRELDELVEAARSCGAAGARLTGAGFGGCAVIAVGAEKLDSVLDGLRKGFYLPRGVDPVLRDALFVAQPSDGARSIRI